MCEKYIVISELLVDLPETCLKGMLTDVTSYLLLDIQDWVSMFVHFTICYASTIPV